MTVVESLAKAVEGVDVVIHLAAKTRARSRNNLYAVNEIGTRNVVRACADCGSPPRLVVVSSLAAAGPGTSEEPRKEADACEPVSDYGRSKLAGEFAAREFADRVPTSIVRPPLVFGGGDRDGLVLVRTIARTGWQIVPRKGLPLSALHADDLAAGISLVVDRGLSLRCDDNSRGVYHLADPNPTSLAEIGHTIAKSLGQELRSLRVRPWVFASGALFCEAATKLGRPPNLLNFDKLREASARGWVTSTEKATSELGFSCHASLAQRYRETIEWYRAHGWLQLPATSKEI